MMLRTIILILILSLGAIPAPSIASESEPKADLLMDENAQRAFIRQKIIERFPDDYHIMLDIAYCETRSRPFIHWEPDGSLRPHDARLSTASGTFQVLVGLHADAIREMGLDMNNIDDYLTFVDRLRREGPNYSAWSESRGCWAPLLASN